MFAALISFKAVSSTVFSLGACVCNCVSVCVDGWVGAPSVWTQPFCYRQWHWGWWRGCVLRPWEQAQLWLWAQVSWALLCSSCHLSYSFTIFPSHVCHLNSPLVIHIVCIWVPLSFYWIFFRRTESAKTAGRTPSPLSDIPPLKGVGGSLSAENSQRDHISSRSGMTMLCTQHLLLGVPTLQLCNRT